MEDKIFYVNSMEELPKGWDYNHTLLELKEEITNEEEGKSLFKMSYFPYFDAILIVERIPFLHISESQIIGFPEFRGIFEGEGKEASLSSIINSRFFLSYPKDLVEEFTKKYYNLYDLLVKNENKLREIPVKDYKEENNKGEYYHLDSILSGLYSPLVKFFKENDVKGLFNTGNGNLLPTLEYKRFSNSGSYHSVRLHKDKNNDFHVVVYFRDWQFSIPLGYTNEMIRGFLLKEVGRLYDPHEAMILIYYKCLQFKEYIKYFNLLEDLSIYDFSEVSFVREKEDIILYLGDLYHIRIQPIIHNLDFYYKVSIRNGLVGNFLKFKVIDFLMDQNSFDYLISFLLTQGAHCNNSLIQSVDELAQYVKMNTKGDVFGDWKFKDGINSWKKLMKNFIEIRYDKDNEKYMYRRYRESEVIDIELNGYTFSDLLVNTVNPDEVENSYQMSTYRKITHNEDLKYYPENIKNMKRYIRAIEELRPEPEMTSEPDMGTNEYFREGELDDKEE